MLHILRRIRRALIESSQMQKYILYALGEILLVMIGILLALQVNNWNETRKSRQLIRGYLTALQEDLQSDQEQLKYNEDQLDRTEAMGFNVWNHLYGDDDKVNASNLNRDFLQLQLFREFLPVTTAYDNLVSSGGVNLIDNRHLQKLLSAYYRKNPFNLRAKDQRAKFMDEYDPYRINYIPDGMLRDFLNQALIAERDLNLEQYAIDWEGLRTDLGYRKLLDQILAMQIPVRWQIEDNREEIAEILVEIDKTLSKE